MTNSGNRNFSARKLFCAQRFDAKTFSVGLLRRTIFQRTSILAHNDSSAQLSTRKFPSAQLLSALFFAHNFTVRRFPMGDFPSTQLFQRAAF